MKSNIKDVFEGKVSNIACGEFNKLYGKKKLSKIDILSIFINSKKHYLNELGKTVGIDGEIITYNSASYICIMPDGYTTEKGDQIYVWMHRKTNGEFGKVNIGIHSDFEIYVSENNSIIIGLLCFENHKHFESFEKSMKNAEIVTDSDFNLRNFFEEHAKQVLNSNDRTLDAKAHSNSKIEYNTNLKTANGKSLFIEGYIIRLHNEYFLINPIVKLKTTIKKTNTRRQVKKGIFALIILFSVFKNVCAQSFSIVVPSGQTLYCSIYQGSKVAIVDSDPLTMKGDLIIPDSVSINNHTYPITGIFGGAFKNCDSLLSIYIPKTINYIEPYYLGHIFEGCSSLKDISVDSENNVFDSRDDCNAIIKTSSNTLIAGCKDAEIPNSVVEIGDHAFHKCSGLTSMTIPNSVIKIGNYAFSDCTGLISLTIPNSVTKIGNDAFFNCNSLTSITIPKTLDSLGHSAFFSCDSLTDVLFLADSCVIVDFSSSHAGPLECFNYCNNITNFVFGENVKYIPSNICKGLTGLTSVTIPKSVERIGSESFSNCTGLREVVINADSCIATGYNTNSSFAGCSGIENITFGENVKNIPPNLCSGMNNLRSVTIPDSVINIGERAFYNCSGLTSITIPDAVTNIGSASFYGCDHITNIIFGNGLRNIGDKAFENCTEVVRIKSFGTEAPTVQSGTFSGMNDNVIVNVPCGSASVYENAAYWHRFDIQEDIMYRFEVKSSDPYCGTVEIVNAPSCDNLEAVVQANPYHNYRFSHWTDGNNDNPRYIVVLKDTSIEAVFVPDDGNESINQFDNNNVNVWSSNKQIYVEYNDCSLSSNDYICVYDLMGRKIKTEKVSECDTQIIGEFESGVYIVKIGNMSAHKVVVL